MRSGGSSARTTCRAPMCGSASTSCSRKARRPAGARLAAAWTSISSFSGPRRAPRPRNARERDGYRILVFPVHHGVAAVGYALAEDERHGEFDSAAADALGVPFGPERGELQRGDSVTLDEGRVVTPDMVVGPTRPGRRIVMPGDTAPVETVRVLSEGADLLVHEATFLEDERGRAADTLHSTALQAAEIARDADVRLLALTHVSPRYFGHELMREAKEVFERVAVPKDFDVIEVPFAERGEPKLVKKGARPERSAPEVVSELPDAAA